MASNGKSMFGRYALRSEIASGGMATVHLGRLLGSAGFTRTVAIKRLHPHLARDTAFVVGFIDEARITARIRHSNVVQTLDVISTDGEVLLVMEYVLGESLARLLATCARRKEPPSPAIVSAILVGALRGLHAAHEARSETGAPLGIVHRDVSPQNILVGADGVSRVLDFGIAKAANRLQVTTGGALKGKIGYLSPEQATGLHVDRRSDVFSAGIVLFEALTASRLFPGNEAGSAIVKMLNDPRPQLPEALRSDALDSIIARSLAKKPDDRFDTALEFAAALESAIVPATSSEVSAWVSSVAKDVLDERARLLAELESEPREEETVVEATATPPPPTGPDPDTGESRNARRAPIVAAAVVLTIVGIGVGSYSLGAEHARVGAGTAAGESVSQTSSPSPEVGSPATTESRAAVEAASAAPRTDPSSASNTAPSKKRVDGSTSKAPKPVSPRSQTSSAGACDNPYVYDDQGIKRIKLECLRR